MPALVKRVDQLRHEMKALRFLLEYHPDAFASAPAREDFQTEDSRRIYDALCAAPTRGDAERAIAALDLEETDVESFLRLGGAHYHVYPELIRERAGEFRRGELELQEP